MLGYCTWGGTYLESQFDVCAVVVDSVQSFSSMETLEIQEACNEYKDNPVFPF